VAISIDWPDEKSQQPVRSCLTLTNAPVTTGEIAGQRQSKGSNNSHGCAFGGIATACPLSDPKDAG
jgi:hypothetical protein